MEEEKALPYRKIPTNKCRINNGKRTSPFSNTIIVSDKTDWFMINLVAKVVWETGYLTVSNNIPYKILTN